MKVAIIDMGSNSLRLLLGEKKNGNWYNEKKQLWTTRLGDRNEDGSLKDESMKASYKAIQDMLVLSQNYGAQVIYAFATSAVREASNGSEFLEAIKSYGPIKTRILSGQEEADYGFKGAAADYLDSGKHYAIIDVGGGSTELALGSKDGVYWTRSYPVGAVRLQNLSEESPQAIWNETTGLWDPMPIQGDFDRFIGIGGTATTLAAMALKMKDYDPLVIQGYKLTREAIEGMIMNLRYMTKEEKKRVAGLPEGRVDIIVAGAEIITSFMDAYEVPCIYVSDKDGMEGIESQL